VTGRAPIPDGYVRVGPSGTTDAVARADIADAIAAILGTGHRLHDWASTQPGAGALRGRGISWSVALPGTTLRIVVRHSRHGGLLAPITRDLFAAPTRAPRELETSRQLAAAGVLTPEVLAYAVYDAPLGLRRADVVTREIAGGEDLLAALVRADVQERDSSLVPAVAELLAALARAGAWHPDLNLKNVLVTPIAPRAHRAWVLDVDVVSFGTPGDLDLAVRNLTRLERSARKLAPQLRSPLSPLDFLALTRAVRGAAAIAATDA
jgi:hypothetical protein